jgi:myo-inositol-1(or 4)-monophosphatase
LLIKEAGGRIEEQSADNMLKDGGRVVASAPAVFEELQGMANKAFSI